MISTVILLLYSCLFNDSLNFQNIKIWTPKMSLGMNNLKSVEHINPSHSEETRLPLEQMQTLNVEATTQLVVPPSLYIASEIGRISKTTDGLSEENNRLREKIKGLKKENDTLKQKIEAMERQDKKQGETIRVLESSQDKLQKELEKVKTANNQLRIEIEEKTSKFGTQNTILTEKVEALTKELEDVEKENQELKRRLEDMTGSFDSMREENQQLRDEVEALKTGHKEISKKLECKETRLALGQVAWLLEKEIGKAVLPGQNMGYTGILKSMKRWLTRNSSTPEGKAAQKRWDDLQKKLNWNEDDHKYALKCLKDLRAGDAHPGNVDLEEARKQLNEGAYIADADKKVCENIIDMIVTARQLNNA